MLFQKKDFISHSNKKLDFKIECDALTPEDWETLAYIISKKYSFKDVYGIPRGGILLESILKKYIDNDGDIDILIVDDVLTTGKSMEDAKKMLGERNIIGVVIFARNNVYPHWIDPIFKMWNDV